MPKVGKLFLRHIIIHLQPFDSEYSFYPAHFLATPTVQHIYWFYCSPSKYWSRNECCQAAQLCGKEQCFRRGKGHYNLSRTAAKSLQGLIGQRNWNQTVCKLSRQSANFSYSQSVKWWAGWDWMGLDGPLNAGLLEHRSAVLFDNWSLIIVKFADIALSRKAGAAWRLHSFLRRIFLLTSIDPLVHICISPRTLFTENTFFVFPSKPNLTFSPDDTFLFSIIIKPVVFDARKMCVYLNTWSTT